MNLYRLELKRVCKTRMTAILLAIALVLAVVMAYLPVTFIGWTELDASGNEVRYTGLKAIRKRQEQQVSGTITPDVMQEALEAYQRVYRQYDASSINDIPVEVFYKELARYQPLVNNAKEAFADPKTGMAPGVMGLTAEDMQNFYSQLPKRLESVIWLEQSGKPGYEQAQAIAKMLFLRLAQAPGHADFPIGIDANGAGSLFLLPVAVDFAAGDIQGHGAAAALQKLSFHRFHLTAHSFRIPGRRGRQSPRAGPSAPSCRSRR